MMTNEPQRLRIFRIDSDVFIACLNGFNNYEFLRLPVDQECPEGTKVLEVWRNEQCRCWELLATHPTFELWMPGTPVDVARGYWEAKHFRRTPIQGLYEPVG